MTPYERLDILLADWHKEDASNLAFDFRELIDGIHNSLSEISNSVQELARDFEKAAEITDEDGVAGIADMTPYIIKAENLVEMMDRLSLPDIQDVCDRVEKLALDILYGDM